MPNLSDEFCEMNDQQMSLILDLLANQSGLPPIDAYKESCVKRRIAARIRRSGCPDIAHYIERLSNNPAEGVALAASLMIHVSQFFRNPTMFEALGTRLKPLFEEQPTDRVVRCWSMGCSAGEEPYSLAMMLLESYPETVKMNQVEVLATDIDGRTLSLAEAGLYDELALREVSPERRDCFFTWDGKSFRLSTAVLRLVKFRQMDLQQIDAYPLADVVLCRNTLIYFNRSAQEKILHGLADILPQDGILVLGKSESMPGPLRCRFATLDPIERMYCRR
jgi:chemotaxis protein methyltransferase CheR